MTIPVKQECTRMPHALGMDHKMENQSHGSYPGSYGPGPHDEACYHDPAHVRQWAATSTAGIDPFMDLGSGLNFPQGMPLDLDPHLAMACDLVQQHDFPENQLHPAPMEHSHGLSLGYHGTGNPAPGDPNPSVTTDMAAFPGQGYPGSPVFNEGQYDASIAFQADSLAYPTPITDDLSFFDTAGANAMCHQASSNGIAAADYSTEWSSQGSCQGSAGFPVADALPESQALSLTTSPPYGSSVSSSLSQASHLDTPLSLTIMDESWSLNHAAHGEHLQFPSIGYPEHVHLPPAQYQPDQRFDFSSLTFHLGHLFLTTRDSTVRPHLSTLRPALPEMDTWDRPHHESAGPGSGGPLQYALPNTPRRPSEGEPTVTARKDPLYQAHPANDGLYHCPFEASEDCKHNPEKLKCNYENPDCALLKFSSTACLLRHEREAHGLHGHGDKPYPCLFQDCDRSQPGQGFPRQWNLRDHMKRVHGFVVPDSSNNGNDYPSPTSSHCSAEVQGTVRRKRSPESSQGAASKKSRNGTGLKSTGNVTQPAYQGGPAASSHQQYLMLKLRMDRTYSDLDPRDIAGFERYKADLAHLQYIAAEIRRGEATQGRY
ncbi:MAG: hypothetical protein Q9163_006217 [Psora crenata]